MARRKRKSHDQKGNTFLAKTLPKNANCSLVYGEKNRNINHLQEITGVQIKTNGRDYVIHGGATRAVRTKVFETLQALGTRSKGRTRFKSGEVQEIFADHLKQTYQDYLDGKLEAEAANQNDSAVKVVPLNLAGLKDKTGIEPLNQEQKEFLHEIFTNTAAFGIGEAGTGKTFLAIAAGLYAMATDPRYKRIVLVRPAVEAGEKLGFLPGSKEDKVDPFLQPLYDATNEIKKKHNAHKGLIQAGKIEVVQLAYLRGRTLKDAFVIADEVQNMSYKQMKLLLTRLGELPAKLVLCGDATQDDLEDAGLISGLPLAMEFMKAVNSASIYQFSGKYVERSTFTNEVVQAIKDFEANSEMYAEYRAKVEAKLDPKALEL